MTRQEKERNVTGCENAEGLENARGKVGIKDSSLRGLQENQASWHFDVSCIKGQTKVERPSYVRYVNVK